MPLFGQRHGMLQAYFHPHLTHIRSTFSAQEEAVMEERFRAIEIACLRQRQVIFVEEIRWHVLEVRIVAKCFHALFRRMLQQAECLVDAEIIIQVIGIVAFHAALECGQRTLWISLDLQQSETDIPVQCRNLRMQLLRMLPLFQTRIRHAD